MNAGTSAPVTVREYPMSDEGTDPMSAPPMTKAPSRRYSVGVYEPALDPGGYVGDFTVTAAGKGDAQRAALEQAAARWPDNHGLAVWRVRPVS